MPQFLDSIQKTVDSVLAQREEFDRAYGRNAVALLEQAPHAVRMMGRMVMDLEVPAGARRQLALAMYYVAEPQDFLGPAHRDGALGFVDDLWVIMATVARVARDVPEAHLARHWAGTVPLQQLLALAGARDVLETHVPARVLTLLRQYLGEP